MSAGRRQAWRGDVVGYTDVWSAAPGDRVRCMVSTSAGSYRASLVRLGGNRPESEIRMSSVIDGEHRGRVQRARAGSCVVVERAEPVATLESVSARVWVWPTLPATGDEQVLLGSEAWALLLDGTGTPCVRVVTVADGPVELKGARSLAAREWALVCASYDAIRGRLLVHVVREGPYVAEPQTASRAVSASRLARGRASVFIAVGGPSGPGARTWGDGHFDGKLEAPTLWGRPLTASQLEASDAAALTGLVAAWRFEHDMGGDHVVDVGPLGLHGRAVNAPTRAMTGHAWQGTCLDPRHAGSEYGVIHFHRDDLEDAGWEPGLELPVPEGLTSGVYAVKLTTREGASDVVPFIVRPPRGGATADVALVLPTLTYLAYANEQPPAADSYAGYRYPDGLPLTPWDEWLVEHPELGMSLYDVHADGSGCCLSSRLRPVPALRPDHRASAFPAPRHLGADLLLVEWLERIGVAFDVLADEDVHRDGVDALRGSRVVLTGSHPEYVTGAMLDAFEGYVGGGGRLMYLGGNGFFWVTSLHPRGHLMEVRRGQTNQLPWDSRPGELHHATTGEPGGLWELRGRPARRLVGVGFAALGEAARPYVRTAAARESRYAWVFDGLDADDVVGGGGCVFGDAGGYEIDRVDMALGSPPETVVLASAEGRGDEFDVFLSGGSHLAKPPVGTPPFARADLAMLERPGGGAVFSVGSIAWVGSLLWRDGDNPVARVTRNVLERFRASDRL